MLRAAEMLSGEKMIFSFLFTLLSSLKKFRQNLVFAALREPIVAWPRPTTGQLCNPSQEPRELEKQSLSQETAPQAPTRSWEQVSDHA